MRMRAVAAGVAVRDEVEPSMAKKTTGPVAVPEVDWGLVAQLLCDVQRRGLPIDGKSGLLAEPTRLELESTLEGEIANRLGYDRHEEGVSPDGNARNGTRSKTVLTKARRVQIDVSQNRAGRFEPEIAS